MDTASDTTVRCQASGHKRNKTTWTGRIAVDRFLMGGGNSMWHHRPVGNIADRLACDIGRNSPFFGYDRTDVGHMSSKVPLPVGTWAPIWYTIIGHLGVHIPSGTWNGSAIFAGLVVVTDRQTDKQTTLLHLQQQAISSYCCDAA